ncbi:MAG: BatD family protein [Methanosarcina sp.]|uniref:BatD family protein n=1 Tax=Methanosarcina sp. TaxID=2213 RepID=UPI002616BE73|nr:BatD family protein [Methanosarcina sp.]MDD3247538.1 BatD family protein [Methanosarcina sp.]
MAKRIALIVLLAVFIFSGLSMVAFAADEVEWVEKQNDATLNWGKTVTVEGYEIKAEDFNEDKMVFVSISKDGEKLKTAPLTAGMEFAYDDEIKVYAQSVDPNYEIITKDGKEFKTGNWNPSAKLDILVRGKPSFDIKIETDKDTYDSKAIGDKRIDVTVTVKNNGEAKAENVVLTVDTGELEVLSGKTKYTYTKVLKEETVEPITFTLKTPTPWEDTDFKITAKTICEDIKDKKYEHEGSKTIKIEQKWDLIVSKSATKKRHMGEPVYVSVTVRNAGLCDINNIILKDSILSNMHLQKDATLDKTLSLKAGETAEKVFEYTLIPEKPGDFTFPKTVATFTLPNGKDGEVTSDNSDTTLISGPYIEITKTVNKQQLDPGDELTVTVTTKNTGNVDASVTVTDTVPSEAKLISGETSFKQVLGKSGGSRTLTYILQMNKKGEVQIPACKASFLDLDKYSGEVKSGSPVVYVGIPMTLEGSSSQPEGSTGSNQEKNEPSGQASTGNTEEDYGDTPGFSSILAVTGLLAGTGLLRKRSS